MLVFGRCLLFFGGCLLLVGMDVFVMINGCDLLDGLMVVIYCYDLFV